MELLCDVGGVIIPGDKVGRIGGIESVEEVVSLRLGAGLSQKKEFVMATRAGLLREKGEKYWVDSSQKRYVPNEGDLVLGIITNRGAEAYDVDLGSAFDGVLPYDQFEKSTKKNRPPWDVGDLVYCRVTLANRDMDPELSCVNSRGKAGEFGGGLIDGHVFKCSIRLARSLFYKNNVVLKALGQDVAFEIAVGMNGRVFVKSSSFATTIKVSSAIQNSEYLTEADTVAMVGSLFETKKKK